METRNFTLLLRGPGWSDGTGLWLPQESVKYILYNVHSTIHYKRHFWNIYTCSNLVSHCLTNTLVFTSAIWILQIQICQYWRRWLMKKKKKKSNDLCSQSIMIPQVIQFFFFNSHCKTILEISLPWIILTIQNNVKISRNFFNFNINWKCILKD